jgi:LuxR family transcriptional regulator, maltose regulon positive regulatory protein
MEPIQTLFVPPVQPMGLCDRPRLRHRLTHDAPRRITLVRSPAGYGKTTLLSQWHEDLVSTGASVAWLTVDGHQRSATSLLSSLAEMLFRMGVGEGLQAFFRDDAQVKADGLMAALVNRLAGAPSPVFLFFDDVHLLCDGALDALANLIRRAPWSTRFVLSMREAAALELGALRAYGQLLELGQADLRFTGAEASRLLAAHGLADLTEPDFEALMARTEGWVTGLKLATFAIDGASDRRTSIVSFSGRRRAVADYFDEDVFARQSHEIQRFLLETSVLDRMSPKLCDALTGRIDAASMLRQLEEAGLFVAALDEEGSWYRYHSLFIDFLRRKLADADPDGEVALRRKAASWLALNGHWSDAMEQASRAGDVSLLGDFLESVAEEFTYTGRLPVVARYAALIPVDRLDLLPWTLLSVAWMKIRTLRYAETRSLLDRARECLEMRRKAGETAEKLESLANALEHREMMLAAAHDDVAQVEHRCNRLLRAYEDRHGYLSCSIYGQLLTARREQFRFDGLEKLYAEGRSAIAQCGYDFALNALQSAAGASLFAHGRTEAARHALESGLQESLRWAGRDSGLSALAALPLAEIHYEANELDEAADLISRHLPVAREWSFPDQLVSGHIVASRLAAAKGDLANARRTLDDAMGVALECDIERLRLSVVHEQVRLLLRSGMPDSAARLVEWSGLALAADACLPQTGGTTRDELRAAIWVRMALSRGEVAEAAAVIKQWRSFCAQRGAVRLQVRWSILMAQAMILAGDTRAAQRHLRDALSAAAPAELIRSLVDEGPVVRAILAETSDSPVSSDHPSDQFARRVLEAFDGRRNGAPVMSDEDAGLYGRLTGKELEILTLVGCGMRNREIGDRLGLSEGSVKWYMQQVYDKVGIRRRSQAVERARQFGLIA